MLQLKNNRHSLRHIVIALAALIGSAAFAETWAQPAPKRGGSAIFAIPDDPVGLNRNVSSNNVDGLVACVIYEGLIALDANSEPQPQLASSWTVSDDGKTYSFELREATWHDGKPFTSEDVKFTLTEVSPKYSALFGAAGQAIDSIETPSPRKAIVRLKHAYGPLLLSLACGQGGAILPAHIFRGTDFLKNPAISQPVGTGPFRFAEWKRGAFIRMVRNANYWQANRPYLDEVIARVIPQATSRAQALLSGDADLVNYINLAPSDYAMLRASGRVNLTPARNFPTQDLLMFNVSRTPLSDKRVRQALMMAIDRELLLRTAFQNNGSVATSPFTNRITWPNDPSIDYGKMYPYDLAKANALLDEAGLRRGANGQRFSLNFAYSISSSPDYGLVTSAIKNMWARIGVEVTIVPADTTTAVRRVFNDRDFDVTIQLYSSFGDPALGIARAYVSSAIGRPFGNPTGYSDQEVDRAFEAAQSAPSREARAAIYQPLFRKLADELTVAAVHETGPFDASTTRLHGLDNEHSLPSWRDAWLSQ